MKLIVFGASGLEDRRRGRLGPLSEVRAHLGADQVGSLEKPASPAELKLSPQRRDADEVPAPADRLERARDSWTLLVRAPGIVELGQRLREPLDRRVVERAPDGGGHPSPTAVRLARRGGLRGGRPRTARAPLP
jgi:hypothetical protein